MAVLKIKTVAPEGLNIVMECSNVEIIDVFTKISKNILDILAGDPSIKGFAGDIHIGDIHYRT